jgi:hypothetical protein
MRRDRKSRPVLESLEGRQLLSSYPTVSTQIQPGGPMIPVASQHVVLTGSIKGTLTSKMSVPDTGHHYVLFGMGRLSPTGMSVATGSLQTPGFIASGQSSGTVTLGGRGGTLKLQLTSPAAPGFSSLPGLFLYNIVSGSGRFHGAAGSGSVTLSQEPSALVLNPARSMPTLGGSTTRFTMTFGSITPMA